MMNEEKEKDDLPVLKDILLRLHGSPVVGSLVTSLYDQSFISSRNLCF